MPRPTKPRWVEFYPEVTYFKPAGVRMRDLEEVSLGVDEVEALRLKDMVGLDQEACARRMNLAQSTFQRLLTSARSKVSSALIQGKALRIEGGNYLLSPRVFACRTCGHEWVDPEQGAEAPPCPKCGATEARSYRKHPGPEGAGGHGPRGGRESDFGNGRRGRHGGGRGGGPGGRWQGPR